MAEGLIYDQTAKALATLIKDVAKAKGITQAQIAERCGLQQPNVASMLSGNRIPTLPVFLKLCNAVGLRVFFESDDANTDLAHLFNKAMDQAGFISREL